jgi:hypothetical protein
MRAVAINLAALTGVKDALDRIARGDIDMRPLLEQGEQIILEGNRDGLIAGTDGDGQAMPRTQREQSVALSRRLGSGRPLVPNGAASRAIRLAKADSGQIGPTTWQVIINWDGFTANNGRNIPEMHANPVKARYPRRNIMDIRPATVKAFEDAAAVYLAKVLRKKA